MELMENTVFLNQCNKQAITWPARIEKGTLFFREALIRITASLYGYLLVLRCRRSSTAYKMMSTYGVLTEMELALNLMHKTNSNINSIISKIK